MLTCLLVMPMIVPASGLALNPTFIDLVGLLTESPEPGRVEINRDAPLIQMKGMIGSHWPDPPMQLPGSFG
jgi:hypothetical protein